MATEANKLKVGTFLIAGFLLFNAALVWIGTSRVLEKTERYVSYFDESVLGLEPGSAVNFRGVAVGRVDSVEVAPDGRLVQVNMDVARGFRPAPGLRATLTTSGLTGISVVELGFARGGAPPPQLSFAPAERYVPSQPSLLTGLTTSFAGLAEQLRGADVPALVADYRAAAVAARARLEAPQIDRTLERVASTAEALETLSRRLAALAEDPRLPATLERLSAAAAHIESAARSAEAFGAGERLDAMQRRVEVALDDVHASAQAAATGVRDTSAAATRAIARWDRLGAELKESLPQVMARLDRTAGRVEGLAASLEADPSRLLAKPPREDFR